MHRVSRRTFLATSFAAAGASAISRRAHAAPLPALTGSTRLEQFDYGDVQLLDGPMLEQFRANHAYFLALNDDSLLQPFRQKAGLPAPGEPMGGWYSWSKDFDPPKNMTGYVPGHTLGQYMSGLARAYAVTAIAATQAESRSPGAGLLPQPSTPKFYEDYPLPAYTSDKTHVRPDRRASLRGRSAGAARSGRTRPTRCSRSFRRRPSRAGNGRAPASEHGLDVGRKLHAAGELLSCLETQRRSSLSTLLRSAFCRTRTYFDPLAEGQNVLPGLHAYSHVNALNSAAQA